MVEYIPELMKDTNFQINELQISTKKDFKKFR